jgi:hypothetical protein
MKRAKDIVGFKRIAQARGVLNRATKGRIGLYSTAEHYSTGPVAKIIEDAQYDENVVLTCPVCGWSGPAKTLHKNVFDELFDLRCPECDQMLLIVSY